MSERITGAEIYSMMDQSKNIPFDSLKPDDDFLYNVFAEAVEVVLEDDDNQAIDLFSRLPKDR